MGWYIFYYSEHFQDSGRFGYHINSRYLNLNIYIYHLKINKQWNLIISKNCSLSFKKHYCRTPINKFKTFYPFSTLKFQNSSKNQFSKKSNSKLKVMKLKYWIKTSERFIQNSAKRPRNWINSTSKSSRSMTFITRKYKS